MNTDFVSSMVAAGVFAVALWILGRPRGDLENQGTKSWSTLIIAVVVLVVIIIFGLIIFRIQGRVGILYFTIMTLGSITKWVWDTIKAANGGDPIFKPSELALPILVSPFIYNAVLSGLAELKPEADPTLVQQFAPFLLAFQNGFFWQTLIDQIKK